MPTIVQFRRGTTAQNNNFTGAAGEISVDTSRDTLRVHDGVTVGGSELVNLSSAQTLSNKTIGSDLIPSTDSAYDLGSVGFKWKDLHLSGSTIYLGGAEITASGSSVVLPTGTQIGDTTLAALDSAGIRGLFSAAGDLTYNASTGEFSFDVENVYTQANFDSDFNTSLDDAALGGTGLTYTAGTNTLSITDTGVAAGTYGSASQVPIFTVNAQGQIDSAGSIAVAGVSGTSWDSSTGNLIINTADGGSFYANVTLDPYSTTDLSEGTNLYYTSARADSDAKNAVSASGDLSYNNGTGVFSFTERTDTEVKNLFNVSGDLAYDSAAGVFSFTERTDTQVKNLFNVSGDLAYDSAAGVFSFTERTDGEVRGLFSAGGDLTYDSATGQFSINSSTNEEVRGLFSASDAGGDGSFAYDSATGTFTYTGPSASEVRAHFSGGTGITITDGSIATTDAEIVHDSLSGFVANKHIDHSGVSITAGNGLTGGGDITATRTLDIGEGTGITVSADAIATNDAEIVHDNLSGFEADEHIAHSGVTLTAGDGLTGGGTIAASRTFNIGAGTGVTVNADDIAIGQDVATTADVTFNSVTTTDGLIVGGNLQVTGTTTTVNSQSLEVTDNMIYMNAGESDGSPTQSVDVGWAANVNDGGSYTHVGMFRDATDDRFKVYGAYSPEPDAALEINTGHASFALADFQAATFYGNLTGNVTGAVTGNASSATILQTARTIGGVSFNGSANINLPGVNTAGNQNTSGNAATATALATGRTISLTGDVTGTSGSFDGSGNVSISATIAANSVALGTDTTGNYVATIATGAGLDGSSSTEGGTPTITLALSELTTSTTDGDGDYFVVVDTSNNQRKLTKGNIAISGFNNDAGYSTTTGTVTSVATGGGLTGGTITGSGTISHADTSSQASVNNSGRTYIQDITLDTYGHITAITSATETVTDTTYSPGTALDLSGTTFNVDLSELSTSTTNGDGDYFVVVDTSNAQRKLTKGNIAISGFNNDAGYSTTTGTVTSVTVSAGTGLSGGGTITSTGTATLNVDLSELTDMTAGMVGTDEFIVLDAGADRRKAANEIGLSIFNNDANFSTTTGTVTSVAGGTGLTGGTITSTGTLAVDVGTTANKIVQLNGSAQLPAVDGSLLTGISAGATVTDKADNVNYNLVFTSETSGTQSLAGIDNTALTYNPSTGILNSTDFNATSDESLKTNIETIQDAASKVAQLRGVNFNWKANDRKAMGVIAQEVEKIIPEVVNEENGTKSVSYGSMVGLLIEAIKDLQNQVNELKK